MNTVKELTEEMSVYRLDEMYTPISYQGKQIMQPHFNGRGNHSVKELEDICEQFQEYVHQQQIIKQNCMKHVIELKFGKVIE